MTSILLTNYGSLWLTFQPAVSDRKRIRVPRKANRSGQSTACLMPIRGVITTSALGEAVVSYLQRRRGAGHVQPVVQGPRQAQRQAQPTRSRSDQSHRRIFVQATIARHLRQSRHWLQGSEQNACPQVPRARN